MKIKFQVKTVGHELNRRILYTLLPVIQVQFTVLYRYHVDHYSQLAEKVFKRHPARGSAIVIEYGCSSIGRRISCVPAMVESRTHIGIR